MWLLLLLLGCPTGTPAEIESCDLSLSLDRTEAAPGDLVVATGGPQSEPHDTSVRLGSTSADVELVTREGCSGCDRCRTSAGCSPCETCTDCSAECATCVQSVTFAIPDVAEGDAAVVITNRYGASDPLPLAILPATVDSGDSGDTD